MSEEGRVSGYGEWVLRLSSDRFATYTHSPQYPLRSISLTLPSLSRYARSVGNERK